MEKAYTKLRMELKDEDDEDEQNRKGEKDKRTETQEQEELDKEEQVREQIREEEARLRQIYDPVENRYDDRKRRVTDLPECNRVTLPKPLRVQREAEIEIRRELHNKIYQQYRREHCKENGDQENNLTAEEKRGLDSLRKRIDKGELVIIKTDKSGKLSATTREKYLEMGEVHIGEDKIVQRQTLRTIDKLMNEHAVAWCGIWNTGESHDHTDRIVSSKQSKSENTAKLYLVHKDHKKEQEKTRPIGTANTSNTRAFANSVSDLLESIANSEKETAEVISTEDLIHNTKKHNIEVKRVQEDWKMAKTNKEKCRTCKIWRTRCQNCIERRFEKTMKTDCEEKYIRQQTKS